MKIEISEQVKESIEDFVLEKNMEESLKELPGAGIYNVESQYQFATNDKFKNNIFVVSQIIEFKGKSISDKRFGIYAFDANTGEQITSFEKDGKCYYGFFEDLKIIERII